MEVRKPIPTIKHLNIIHTKKLKKNHGLHNLFIEDVTEVDDRFPWTSKLAYFP